MNFLIQQLWDVMSGQEAFDLIKDEKNAETMAMKLLKKAVSSHNCIDNVTVVVARL